MLTSWGLDRGYSTVSIAVDWTAKLFLKCKETEFISFKSIKKFGQNFSIKMLEMILINKNGKKIYIHKIKR